MFFLFSCHFVYAQQTNSGIRGYIRDTEGKPIVGASVRLVATTDGSISGIDGSYQILKIQPGKYIIEVSHIGFTKKTSEIIIQQNSVKSIDFTLNFDTKKMNEVIIVGKTEETIARESAKSIEVLSLKEASIRSADLGQVLAQTKGVSVQRDGGLGSSTRISMNGLTDDQIRYFYDDVPLDFSAYNFGFANVPLGSAERVDIYKGVVPAFLGADALGGALNLIPKEIYDGVNGSFSYQIGSFGTHRTEASLTTKSGSGFFTRTSLFYDVTRNDYSIDIGIPDIQGRLNEETVDRFNDDYKGYGAIGQIGILEKGTIENLSLEFYTSFYDKDIQHAQLVIENVNGQDLIAGIPFGEVQRKANLAGANIRYEQSLGNKWGVDIDMGYNYAETKFRDDSDKLFNWRGEVVEERTNLGEINNGQPARQSLWSDNMFLRGAANYQLTDNGSLLIQSFARKTRRTGRDEFSGSFDPFGTKSDYTSNIATVNYNSSSKNEQLELNVFAKNYYVAYESEEPQLLGDIRFASNSINNWGGGTSIRYLFKPSFLGKFSYEYATRLPRVDEVLGDGAFISDNLDLIPERGHNLNLELQIKSDRTSSWNWEINPIFFLREIRNHIVFIQGIGRTSVYANVFDARSMGGELGIRLTSKDERLQINANTTYQNYVNTSKEGLFAGQSGDRIPNRPFLFANASVAYGMPVSENNRLSLFADARYVGDYFLAWESLGTSESKQNVPEQFVTNIGSTYKTRVGGLKVAFTGEVFNLFDARAFDFFATQRPGTSFFLKSSVQF